MTHSWQSSARKHFALAKKFQKQANKHLHNFLKKMSNKQKAIGIVTFTIGAVIILSIIIPPTLRSIRISMITKAAETVVAESSRTYSEATETLEENTRKMEILDEERYIAQRDKLCSQCNAYQARVDGCLAGVEKLCEDAKTSAQSLIDSWYGEIVSICYRSYIEDPCLDEEKYPGDVELTLITQYIE